jgi:lysyl-tRNA synthetase class 2
VLGGRVVGRRGRTLRVADALASTPVTLGEPVAVEVGQLVTVRGRLEDGAVHDARVLSVHGGRPGLEFDRLARGRVAANLVARSRALRAVRRYFEREGFVEVATPVRVKSPGLDAHVQAFQARDGWLITSPELAMKRLVVGGMPKIFQICHASRREELGPWHEPEYTLLEWYRAFAGVEATLADTERVVARVARAVTGSDQIAIGRRKISLQAPFPRVTIREAFARHAQIADAVSLAEEDEEAYFQAFVDHVEPALARARTPVFLVDFPACQGALARRKAADPTVVERYELVVAGVELCNGYGELTDPGEQRRRFSAERQRRRRAKEPQHPMDPDFLESLKEGLPPSSGNALGLDRLVALCLGLEEIAPVMSFPARSRCD